MSATTRMVWRLMWSSLLLTVLLRAEPLQFEMHGEAVILMNADTRVILLERNAHVRRYPASTTKVATGLYVLAKASDKLDLLIEAQQDSLASVTQEAKQRSGYTLPAHWLEPDGMHMGIKKGEIFSLRDLLKGMLICSANDAANVMAHALGPTVPVFMEGMNAYLREIGCIQTQFYNPHGLHDARHQTTAHDLALMGCEALKHPLFCDIVLQPRFIRPKTNKQAAITLLQTNRLVRPGKFYYPKAIGIKTGYHAKAKKNLVAAARMEDRTLVAVFLGYSDSSTLFEEAIQLFEMAFNQPKVQRTFLKAGSQRFTLDLPKGEAPLHTYLQEALTLEYYPAEEPQAKCLLYWRTLALPIVKDQPVADLRLIGAEGQVLAEAPLLATEAVGLAWPYNWIDALASLSWGWWTFVVACACLGTGVLVWSIRRQKL